MLDSLLNALNTLNEGDFAGTTDCIPQPYLREGATGTGVSKYDLPSVLVPPEIIEVEGITSEAGSEAQIKKEEWPEYYFRIFTSDVRTFSSPYCMVCSPHVRYHRIPLRLPAMSFAARYLTPLTSSKSTAKSARVYFWSIPNGTFQALSSRSRVQQWSRNLLQEKTGSWIVRF